MGFLKRVLAGRDQPVPDWAGFFTPEEYRSFIGLVEADLRRRGIAFTMGDGLIVTEGERAGGQQLGLTSLAQKCHAAPRSDWQIVISGHLTAILAMQGRDMDAVAADFEQARRILRLRLFPDETTGGPIVPPGIVDGPVLRPLVSGIEVGLVFDFPDATTSVSEAHLRQWPVGEDEVLGIALEETLAEPLPLRAPISAPDGTTVDMLRGDSFYVASRILGLQDLLGPDDVYGAIAAVPNRHALLWHPVRSLRTVTAMQTMIPIVGELYRTGPGSISHQLYWWSDGDLFHISVAGDGGGKVNLTLPEGLVDILNRFPDDS